MTNYTEIYKLSEGHKNAIEIAKAQIDEGEFLTNEEANKEIEKWLNELTIPNSLQCRY